MSSLAADLSLHQATHLSALATALRGGVPAGLPDQLRELEPVLNRFDAARSTIERDRNLTEIGRQNKLADERANTEAAISAWATQRVTGIESQIHAVETARRTAAEKGVTPPTDFQVRYTAEKLAQLDPLETAIAYHSATPDEQRVFEAAAMAIGRQPRKRADGSIVLEHAIDPARIAATQAARLDAADPSAADALADLDRLKNTFHALAATAIALVRQ